VSDPESPAPIIDSVSHQAVELAELGSKIPVQTRVGSRLLTHLLYRGLPDAAAVERQQEAVQELLDGNYGELRESLKTAIGSFGNRSDGMEAFTKKGIEGTTIQGYTQASLGARALERIVESTTHDRGFPLRAAPTRESIHAIREFNETHGAALLRGPLYYTLRGLRAREEDKPLGPRKRFHSIIGPQGALISLGSLGGTIAHLLPPEFLVGAAPLTVVVVNVGINTGEGQLADNIKDSFWNNPLGHLSLDNT